MKIKKAYFGVEERQQGHTALRRRQIQEKQVLSRKMVISGQMGSVHTDKIYVFFFLLYIVIFSNHPHLLLLQNILWAPGIHLIILLRKSLDSMKGYSC